MYKIIAPIQNLIIQKSIPTYDIYIPGEVINQFDEYFVDNLGLLQMKTLHELPSFFEIENDIVEDPRVFLHKWNTANNSVLGIGFWLLKDCSCFSNISFLRDHKVDFVYKDSRNVFFSNSKGKYIPTSFSYNEISDIYVNYITLANIMQQIEYVDPPIEHGQIIGNSRVPNYNDYDRLYRAVNFVTYARSTSLLPQKISNYIVSLESLFGNGELNDLNFKLSHRIPHFFEISFDEKKEIYDIIRAGYDIRSRFLHGDKLHKKHTYDYLANVSSQLDNILRTIIRSLIENDDLLSIILNPEKFTEYFSDKLLR